MGTRLHHLFRSGLSSLVSPLTRLWPGSRRLDFCYGSSTSRSWLLSFLWGDFFLSAAGSPFLVKWTVICLCTRLPFIRFYFTTHTREGFPSFSSTQLRLPSVYHPPPFPTIFSVLGPYLVSGQPFNPPLLPQSYWTFVTLFYRSLLPGNRQTEKSETDDRRYLLHRPIRFCMS